MTRRAKAFLSFVMVGTCAVAGDLAAAAPQETPSLENGADVTNALMINFEGGDLRTIAAGVAGMMAGQTFTGRDDTLVQQQYWLTTIGVQGIAYSFRVAGIDVVPESGYLAAYVRLADLQVDVENIYFNSSNSWGCRHLPISSGGAEIPATSNVSLWAENHALQVAANTSHVGLDDNNFRIGTPAECDGALGVGWLLQQAMPWIVGLARDQIADAAAEAAGALASKTGATLNNYLNIAVTLPVSVPPAQGFNATVELWPDRIEITPERFRLIAGARVGFDPDRTVEEVTGDVKALPMLADAMPSWVGLGRELFAAVAAEGVAKDLFDLEINADALPWAADRLTVASLGKIIPDAATRFPADAPVSISIGSAASSKVGLIPCGPGGIPIIDTVLENLTVAVAVAGKPYYTLQADMRVGLAGGYRREGRELATAFDSLALKVISHGFAAGVSPEPQDPSFSDEALAQFVDDWNADLLERYTRVFSVTLPDVPIGGKSLEFVGSRVEEDFLTIDATVQ